MKDRISTFLEAEKMTSAEFADRIGVQRSNISHIMSGRNQPGFSFIQKMLEAFPKINSRWLITGEGSMYGDTVSLPATKKEEPKAMRIEAEIPFPENKSTEEARAKEDIPIQKPDMKPAGRNTAEEGMSSPTNTHSKRIKKVLIIYENHTFDEYNPAE
ncbi:MAG TPA: helix-turn-helix transcriptional regulator [Prolixibacteraceae bacterium]|nr:helix-turn-helix transcriptional regulator [Prolixibacteraceae bacterium]